MSAEVWAGVRALASAAQRRSEPPKARAIAGVDPEGAAAQKQKRREKRLRIFTGEARAGRCVRAGNSFRVKAGAAAATQVSRREKAKSRDASRTPLPAAGWL